MNKIKFLLIALLLLLTCVVANDISAASSVHVGNVGDGECVYTLSDAQYDEETGELTYQKITYSKNTYLSIGSAGLDAGGSSVDVSADAQYVFIPATYTNVTSNTVVSFKYKNSGVERIYLHAEYGPGISEGGVDYEAGYTLCCVDALGLDSNAWNVDQSKSVDGYDVVTITFGNYATKINDVLLRGFRLYLDYTEEVDSERSFEIYGCTVHEPSSIPVFASDPKTARVSKLTSADTIIKKNSFTVVETATIDANIYDYTTNNKQLAVKFKLDNSATINFKLDDESIVNEEYGLGEHEVRLPLSKSTYSKFQMVFTAENTVVQIQSIEFLAKPYVDTLMGKGYNFSEENGVTTVTYNHIASWNAIKAAIKLYNTDYDVLEIDIDVKNPMVIGIRLDEDDSKYLRSHHKFTDPVPVGTDTLRFELNGINITSESVMEIFLDPGDGTATGATKTIVFKRFEFIDTDALPKANVSINPEFNFTYDGKEKIASGATTNSGEELIYEYKLEGTDDKYYNTTAPVDAGTYVVRVTSPATAIYRETYAYAKLTIAKVTPSKPGSGAIKVDYANSCITYDMAVYTASTKADFSDVILSGGFIQPGMTIYYKYVESQNYYESPSAHFTVSSKKGTPFSVSVNYARERTVEDIPETVEYSTDGLTWISGNGKKVILDAGNIYLFRTKATSSAFASDITYLAINYRALNTHKLELESTNKTSITLKKIDGVEYRLSDTNWQDSNVFDHLTEGSKVTIYMRIKGSATTYASEEVSIEVVVGKMTQQEENPNDKPSEEKPSEDDKNDNKKEEGCGGSVVASIISLITLTTTVLYVKNKRKEDN